MKKLSSYLDDSMYRYLIVGIINTIVGSAIMFGLYNLFGCSYWFSSAMNYIFASILSFFLNKYYTFRNYAKFPKQMFKFAINILFCYIIAYALAKPLVYLILKGMSENIRDNVSLFIGMCLFTILNYLGQRFFAFKQQES